MSKTSEIMKEIPRNSTGCLRVNLEQPLKFLGYDTMYFKLLNR